MTTIGRRRRYLTGDSTNELEDDHTDMSNSNPPLINKRRVSATADFASHRLIVSERQQLAVLKQLTASDETNGLSSAQTNCHSNVFFSIIAVSSPSSSIHSQPRSMKVFRRNEHGETIVHIAARKGDLKQLKQALKDGANVNEEDNAGKRMIDLLTDDCGLCFQDGHHCMKVSYSLLIYRSNSML